MLPFQADVDKLKTFKQKAKGRIMSHQRATDGRFDEVDELLEESDQVRVKSSRIYS